MTAKMAEALAALERVAGRIETLEEPLARRQADAIRLQEEVEATIGDLDRLIAEAKHA